MHNDAGMVLAAFGGRASPTTKPTTSPHTITHITIGLKLRREYLPNRYGRWLKECIQNSLTDDEKSMISLEILSTHNGEWKGLIIGTTSNGAVYDKICSNFNGISMDIGLGQKTIFAEKRAGDPQGSHV